MSNQHKTTKTLTTKQAKRDHKEYRKARQQARGRQWQMTA